MKRVALLLLLCPFALAGLCQGLQMKNRNPQIYVLRKSSADYTAKMKPKTISELTGMPDNSARKTATDRQVDSVYRNIYRMETPVFYESTEGFYEPVRELDRK